MRILVTSVGTATSVNLIRGLKKEGHTVLGTDINPLGYTAGSMLADCFFRIPPASDPGYASALIRILRAEQADLLIPVHDEELEKVASDTSRFPCRVFLPEVSVIRLFRDKTASCEAVAALGVAVPRILKEDDLSVARILKPRVSVGSKGIRILPPGEAGGPWDPGTHLLQAFIDGEEYTVDNLCDGEGNPAWIIPRKRLEVKSGVATKVLVEKNEALISLVRRILSRFLLPGFSNMQFIRSVSGEFFFVEVNPRFSGCGAATLAVTEGYLEHYLDFARGGRFSGEINQGVAWNSVVTRYYEEVVYHADHL